MRRLSHPPRANWQTLVEKNGLHFHTVDGQLYWDESASYHFSSSEIDTLESATNSLHQMCLETVQQIIDDRLFKLFLIPEYFEEYVVSSWVEDQFSLYGRFDLAYDGLNPPKLLEYNSDTPTSLLEAAVIQWFWLKDLDDCGDQFNSIHERLIECWKKNAIKFSYGLHFCATESVVEDYVTVEYLRDTAIQAGLKTNYLDIQQVGWDRVRNTFVDVPANPIQNCFKLYPWEWMMREEFARYIPKGKTQWIEPAWKVLLSSKSILPLLYERYPDCPFVLPASFEPLDVANQVRKPIYGREGANIQVIMDGKVVSETSGPYEQGPFVYQQLAPLKQFDGFYPVIGSWVIDGESAGIGIREEDSIITKNTSRFVPHQLSN